MSHPSYSIALSAILAATGLSFECVARPEMASSHFSPLIAAGSYFDGFTFRPLLAVSQDEGGSWAYPQDITNIQ